MKNFTFLVAGFFFFGSVANASEIIKSSDVANFKTFSDAEPISFTERGIEFYVFLTDNLISTPKPLPEAMSITGTEGVQPSTPHTEHRDT